MPTSDHHNISPIMTIMRDLKPNRVLDIGCGFGKYGVLLREYLDVWDERLTPADWKLNLVGIEAYSDYRNAIHDYVYNKVHYGEAQALVPQLGDFDVVLIADVIEHLEKTQATQLVETCFQHSPVVVISTPRDFYPQGSICSNPYEIHRNLWTKKDFPPNVTIRTLVHISCNIFVASRQPLDPTLFILADPANYIYLRSRYKLGNWGWPISVALRALCRWLA